ncbi:major facilitator superfamily domain-containing protein [Parachaetomium inaequale]|uniref:Major facilitator superfamily domain-containing protein n=1 Tax=Parachaetomium inaequale TaxID=2588326 RepID=A0AAN6PFN4_9PEZI|nr:major facilitator superfamily domain-containing protein [Parachaetomium inaequale]
MSASNKATATVTPQGRCPQTAQQQPSPIPPSPPNNSSSNEPHQPPTESPEPYSTFPPSTRTYLTYLLGFTITLSTLTATIYFPLIPLLATTLSVPIQSINLTVTAYAIAQALSPALFASLADSPRVGRRPVLLALVALYAAASLGLALNSMFPGENSYAALLALRVLQSVAGSPTPALAYGIVADVAPVAERGAMLGPLLATCNALSAVGPVVGGSVALATEGVEWVFLALLFVAVVSFLLVGFTMPETGRGLVGNGERVELVGGVWRTWWSFCRGKGVLRGGEGNLKRGDAEKGRREGVGACSVPPQRGWSLRDALASFRIILYKDAFAVLWMVASSYSVYYTFQVAIPVIFDEVYGYNDLEIGLVFLPGLAGMTIGGMVAGKLVDRNYLVTAKQHGFEVKDKGKHDIREFPIEAARYRHCLILVFIEMLLVIGYGWAVWFGVHPSVPIILQFFACALSTMLSHTGSALLVDIFPDSSSSAYASGQLMRCGLCAVSAAVLQPIVDAVGRGWYFTMFSLFVSVSCAASVVVSQWKGMDWRQKRFKQSV